MPCWKRCGEERREGAAIAPWRLHDLRRTAVTGMRSARHRRRSSRAPVNHISGVRSGVAGVYNKAELLPERRAALERWSTHTSGPRLGLGGERGADAAQGGVTWHAAKPRGEEILAHCSCRCSVIIHGGMTVNAAAEKLTERALARRLQGEIRVGPRMVQIQLSQVPVDLQNGDNPSRSSGPSKASRRGSG